MHVRTYVHIHIHINIDTDIYIYIYIQMYIHVHFSTATKEFLPNVLDYLQECDKLRPTLKPRGISLKRR